MEENNELRQRALDLVSLIGCNVEHRRNYGKRAVRPLYDTQLGEVRRIYVAIRDGGDVRSYCETLACIVGGLEANQLRRLFTPPPADSLPGMPLPGES